MPYRLLAVICLALAACGCGRATPSIEPASAQAFDATAIAATGSAAKSGAGDSPAAPLVGPLSIAAAANVRFALDAIIADFQQRHPQAKIQVVYGSSGNLFAQITSGAPHDVFLSADTRYPAELVKAHLARPDQRFAYARGQLALWTAKSSPLPLETACLDTLVDPRVVHVAIAHPELAPYGRAAEIVLAKKGYSQRLAAKLVFGEDVAQAMQFVDAGAAEIGLVAYSLTRAPSARERGRAWIVPLDLYPPIVQHGVILNAAQHRPLATAFRDFLLSPAGLQILERYGYVKPDPDS